MSESSTENPYQATTTAIESSHDNSGGELATRTRRFFARLIDELIIIVLVAITTSNFVLGSWSSALDPEMPNVESLSEIFSYLLVDLQYSYVSLLSTILWFSLFIACNLYLMYNYGQTIGKRLLGIRMCRHPEQDVAPVSKTLWLREGVAVTLNLIIPLFALVDALFIFRKDRRCLHDLWAGTVVLSEP